MESFCTDFAINKKLIFVFVCPKKNCHAKGGGGGAFEKKGDRVKGGLHALAPKHKVNK